VNHEVALAGKVGSVVFDVGLRTDNPRYPFARHVPVFNWYYPFEVKPVSISSLLPTLESVDWSLTRRRAAYFHIPFCDTVCTFCPFTKGRYTGDSVVDDYLRALFREVQLKRPYVGKLDIEAIFVGGGTPSVMTSSQISMLGECISTYFDTTNLREFAVEVEVKSVTRDKLLAFSHIGVNRVSFGVQTFSQSYRRTFSLDAELSQIARVADWANELFPYTNIDMIYGIAGQQIEDVVEDAESAIKLGTTTIDFYMLNNLAAQNKMHKALEGQGLQRPTAKQRLEQRQRLAEFMLSCNFARISGYSYALKRQSDETLIQTSPRFLYHDILYGFHDDAVVGYGASALSRIPGYNLYNVYNRAAYVAEILDCGTLPSIAYHVGERAEKGVVGFPYRGVLAKSRTPWPSVPPDTVDALRQLVSVGLVAEAPDEFQLTETGWLYYVNLMYFLMPDDAKLWLSDEIAARIAAGRGCEDTELLN
jgi:coproporphyrinogen III oxidase-like Fe-S oxidoreductase